MLFLWSPSSHFKVAVMMILSAGLSVKQWDALTSHSPDFSSFTSLISLSNTPRTTTSARFRPIQERGPTIHGIYVPGNKFINLLYLNSTLLSRNAPKPQLCVILSLQFAWLKVCILCFWPGLGRELFSSHLSGRKRSGWNQYLGFLCCTYTHACIWSSKGGMSFWK